jgi:nucleoside-diphosphate-sugar epimerase
VTDKKIYVVTGGAGFIGSHMAAYLMQQGHTVRVVDNMLTGKQSNLDYLRTVGEFEFHLLDAADAEALMPVFDGVDAVFHFAALPSVPLSVEDPLATNHHGVDATLGMLIAAKDSGVRRVVYTASSAAYGEADDPNITEDRLPAPISPYGVAKLVGEYYCQAFSASYGMETVILRYFNVFGTRQDPNSQYAAVIPKFITLMLDSKQPMIFGDGEQTRDFTHVDNIVHANWLAANAGEEAVGKVFNIATGTSISVNEMLQSLNNVMGMGVAPIYADERKGDIKHSGASIDRARELLGFEPIMDFESGLAQTVAWYREQTNA